MGRKRRSNGQGTLFKRTEGGPWLASWYDYTGKRRERSTRTTDRKAAERILAKHVADTALRRDGVIDARKDRFGDENRKPLSAHVEDYLGHCRHAGHAGHGGASAGMSSGAEPATWVGSLNWLCTIGFAAAAVYWLYRFVTARVQPGADDAPSSVGILCQLAMAAGMAVMFGVMF